MPLFLCDEESLLADRSLHVRKAFDSTCPSQVVRTRQSGNSWAAGFRVCDGAAGVPARRTRETPAVPAPSHGFVFESMKLFASLFLFLLAFALVASAAPPPAEVVVLCALHQLHEQTSFYSYADLSAAIERLQPDVLAVELTPADLKNKVEQKNKREYQSRPAVALEPEDPRRSELIGSMRQAAEALQKTSPQKGEAFDTYTETLFQYLLSQWHSPADVNASWTDRLFAVKHEFQSAIYGSKEVEGWEGWNGYFLEQIVAAAAQHPSKRIVVIVGAEHAYWLREHLRTRDGIKLLDTAALLQR